MSFCDELGQYAVWCAGNESAYLTCNITEPTEYEIDNTSTEREHEEHQRVKVALLCEFGAGIVEDVG